MPQGLPKEVVDKLKLILPWAESASPIVGQGVSGGIWSEGSSPNSYNPADPAGTSPNSSSLDGTQGNVFDQTPTAQPLGTLPPGDKCDLPTEPGVNIRDLKPGFI